MSEQAILNELRKISKQLEPEDSYFDRDQHTLGSVVTLPAETLLSGALEEYNQYVITTDGDIGTITYQVRSKTGASFGAEIEAKDLAYIPGPVRQIRFGNDTVQSGKNINLIKYHISRLAPPMIPPSPPGTRSELVDPHLGLGGTGVRKIELPFLISQFTGVGPLLTFTFDLTDTKQYSQLEKPKGTLDFAVATGKRLILFYIHILTATATKGCGLAYGDDAVDNSATGPTNTVDLTQGSNWHNATAEETFEGMGCFVFVPAGKVPHISAESTSGNLSGQVLGVEVDA